jgi:hypothetical protein
LQVSYRLLRLYGDLRALLKRRLNKRKHVPAVAAQMEQCNVVALENFGEDSSESRSVEEVYQYSVDLMAASNRPILQEKEALGKDLNALETTFEKQTGVFVDSLPDTIKDVALTEMSQDS